MGTTELIIVFSALIALIALVAIGIDWIGKPLKNRRFIPRMYRFEDEKLPVDIYGNTTLGHPDSLQDGNDAPFPPIQAASPLTPTNHAQPAPVVVARVDHASFDTDGDEHPAEAVPRPALTPSRSAFSDNLSDASAAPAAGEGDAAPADTTALRWTPDLALDATVDADKPSLATKATRFWIATAASIDESHFDGENLDRMRQGKAPRRTNPRTGKLEAMQLTGLRQASDRDEVRMRWPGDSIDPWSAK